MCLHGVLSICALMLPCCALMLEMLLGHAPAWGVALMCLNPKLLIGQASQWWGHWCSNCLSGCFDSPLLGYSYFANFVVVLWITTLCSIPNLWTCIVMISRRGPPKPRGSACMRTFPQGRSSIHCDPRYQHATGR